MSNNVAPSNAFDSGTVAITAPNVINVLYGAVIAPSFSSSAAVVTNSGLTAIILPVGGTQIAVPNVYAPGTSGGTYSY